MRENQPLIFRLHADSYTSKDFFSLSKIKFSDAVQVGIITSKGARWPKEEREDKSCPKTAAFATHKSFWGVKREIIFWEVQKIHFERFLTTPMAK